MKYLPPHLRKYATKPWFWIGLYACKLVVLGGGTYLYNYIRTTP